MEVKTSKTSILTIKYEYMNEKINVWGIIEKLKQKVDKKDFVLVNIVTGILNNAKQDTELTNLAIDSIKRAGYTELARYMDFFNKGHYEISISDKQKLKLGI